jgi:hypothetical protein
MRRSFDAATGMPFRWIAVAYADWSDADAPPPEQIIAAAIETGCAGVLFDTFQKHGATLLDCLSPAELSPLVERIRAAGLLVALAGSLRAELLPALLPLRPDVVAIRGAACAGSNRGGAVDAERVAAFRGALQDACSDVGRHSSGRHA